MANPVIWFEVMGKDAKKLRGFYAELFDWKYQMVPDPSMDYGMTDKQHTGIGGGVGTAQSGPGWVTFYVGVPDVATALRRAESLGAKVLMPVTKLPDTTIAVFADPEGHPIGLASAPA